ncbi:MAG: hypothetical protein Q9203_002921 [Teloschistes exilis]
MTNNCALPVQLREEDDLKPYTVGTKVQLEYTSRDIPRDNPGMRCSDKPRAMFMESQAAGQAIMSGPTRDIPEDYHFNSGCHEPRNAPNSSPRNESLDHLLSPLEELVE